MRATTVLVVTTSVALLLLLRLSLGRGTVATTVFPTQATPAIYAAPPRLCLGGSFNGKCINNFKKAETVFQDLMEHCTGTCSVLDVGSNKGDFGKAARLARPGADQLSLDMVEPHPVMYQKLVAAFGNDPAMRVHNTAASSTRSTLVFGLQGNGTTYTDVRANAPACRGARKEWVDPSRCTELATIPLDEMLRPARHIDVMKIDVQGHEYEALQGALGLVQAHGVDVILTELSPSLFPVVGHARLYLKLLTALGYRLFLLDQGLQYRQGRIRGVDMRRELKLPRDGSSLIDGPLPDKHPFFVGGGWGDVLCVHSRVLRS